MIYPQLFGKLCRKSLQKLRNPSSCWGINVILKIFHGCLDSFALLHWPKCNELDSILALRYLYLDRSLHWQPFSTTSVDYSWSLHPMFLPTSAAIFEICNLTSRSIPPEVQKLYFPHGCHWIILQSIIEKLWRKLFWWWITVSFCGFCSLHTFVGKAGWTSPLSVIKSIGYLYFFYLNRQP